MSIEIERRTNLSLAEFEAKYVSKSMPVILTDATASWPARKKWNLDYFESKFNEKVVHFDDRDWKVGDFVRGLKSHRGGGVAPYLKMVKLDDQFPELWDDVGGHALAQNNLLKSRLLPRSMRIDKGIVALFIGTKGSGLRTLHWDWSYLHVFISQVCGDKDAILFRPEDTPFLYARTDYDNLSRLPDPFNVDSLEFPEFGRAQPIKITIKEGETLFLPGGWWHATYIGQPNVAIAESTLDRFNWHVRKDWYLNRRKKNGGALWKRLLLKPYMILLSQFIFARNWLGSRSERVGTLNSP